MCKFTVYVGCHKGTRFPTSNRVPWQCGTGFNASYVSTIIVPLPQLHSHTASAINVLCLCRCSTVCSLRGYYIYTVPVQDYACAAAAVPATESDRP